MRSLVNYNRQGRHSNKVLDLWISNLCGEKVIRPRSDPTAGKTFCFWTKPATMLTCNSLCSLLGLSFEFWRITGLCKTHLANEWHECSQMTCVAAFSIRFANAPTGLDQMQTVWCEKEAKRLKDPTACGPGQMKQTRDVKATPIMSTTRESRISWSQLKSQASSGERKDWKETNWSEKKDFQYKSKRNLWQAHRDRAWWCQMVGPTPWWRRTATSGEESQTNAASALPDRWHRHKLKRLNLQRGSRRKREKK